VRGFAIFNLFACFYLTNTSFENNKYWISISNKKKAINALEKIDVLFFCLK